MINHAGLPSLLGKALPLVYPSEDFIHSTSSSQGPSLRSCCAGARTQGGWGGSDSKAYYLPSECRAWSPPPAPAAHLITARPPPTVPPEPGHRGSRQLQLHTRKSVQEPAASSAVLTIPLFLVLVHFLAPLPSKLALWLSVLLEPNCLGMNLCNGDKNSVNFFRLSWGLNELTYVKYLAQGSCSMNENLPLNHQIPASVRDTHCFLWDFAIAAHPHTSLLLCLPALLPCPPWCLWLSPVPFSACHPRLLPLQWKISDIKT